MSIFINEKHQPQHAAFKDFVRDEYDINLSNLNLYQAENVNPVPKAWFAILDPEDLSVANKPSPIGKAFARYKKELAKEGLENHPNRLEFLDNVINAEPGPCVYAQRDLEKDLLFALEREFYQWVQNPAQAKPRALGAE